MNNRELREDEESATTRLLEYIAQYRTTKGGGIALGGGGPSVAPALKKLLVLGYIKTLGNRRYEVTDKGWEFLGGPGQVYYERVPVVGRTSGLARKIGLLEREINKPIYIPEEDWEPFTGELKSRLEKLSIGTKDLSREEALRLSDLLDEIGESLELPVELHPSPSESEVESFQKKLSLLQDLKNQQTEERRGYTYRRILDE